VQTSDADVEAPRLIREGARNLMRTLVVPVVIGAATALAFFLAMFVFRLGYFVVLVIPAGALCAAILALVRPARGTLARVVAAVAAIVSYSATTAALYVTTVGQETSRTYVATWRPGSGERSEKDILAVLEFLEAPGFQLRTTSTEMRDYLVSTGTNQVEVEIVLTSDLWCVRGFHVARVGDRTRDLNFGASWSSLGSLNRKSPHLVSPWDPEPSWCR
jgi:hypothetical protein